MDGDPKQDLNGSKNKRNFQESNGTSEEEEDTKIELEANCGTKEKVSVKYSKRNPWTITI